MMMGIERIIYGGLTRHLLRMSFINISLFLLLFPHLVLTCFIIIVVPLNSLLLRNHQPTHTRQVVSGWDDASYEKRN